MANIIINNVIGQQLSGSLTKLGDGTTPYLTTNDSDLFISTGSNGSVDISLAEQYPVILSESVFGVATTTSGTSITIDKPTGTIEGDLLVAIITLSSDNTSTFVQELSGWQTIANKRSITTGVGNAIYAAYRIAGNAEPANYTWTFPVTAGRLGRIIRISGFNPKDPICYTDSKTIDTATTQIQAPGFLSPNYKTLRITATGLKQFSFASRTNDLSGNLLTTLSNNSSIYSAHQSARWQNTSSSTSLADLITWSDSDRLNIVDILINPLNKSTITKNTYFYDRTVGSNFVLTIPLWATTIEIDAVGGGGGGGSGRRSTVTTETRCGGAGGGAGARTQFISSVSKLRDLGDRLLISVGQGGAGGASITATNANGNAGSSGTITTVQVSDGTTPVTILSAPGGNSGAGGTTATTSTGGDGILWQYTTAANAGGGGGGRSNINGLNGTNATTTAGGGGGAGGINTSNVASNGGSGGTGSDRFINELGGGGTGGTQSVTQSVRDGAAATAYTSALILPGSGGGGGAGYVGAPGGTGGAGYRGGGGGGGGASTTSSGAGGAGGNGYVLIKFY